MENGEWRRVQWMEILLAEIKSVWEQFYWLYAVLMCDYSASKLFGKWACVCVFVYVSVTFSQFIINLGDHLDFITILNCLEWQFSTSFRLIQSTLRLISNRPILMKSLKPISIGKYRKIKLKDVIFAVMLSISVGNDLNVLQ